MPDPQPQVDESARRRARLLDAQLRGLIAEHRGMPVDAPSVPLPIGAGRVIDDPDDRSGADAWVLVDADGSTRPGRALGPAMAWARRQEATGLHLISAAEAGSLARRASRFAWPVDVWFPEGRDLLPVVEEPLASPPPPRPEHRAFGDEILSAGADLVVEHGIVTGEVHGLEVCRVVDGADGVARLDVGVGAQDRDAFGLLHGDQPPIDALAKVAATVAAHRTADAAQHPLNRVARERLLRWQLIENPTMAGLDQLAIAEPPVARGGLKETEPCFAVGRDADGRTVSVVVSSGVDLDLAPYVADIQIAHDQPVLVVLPSRDVLPITTELLSLLRQPVEVRAIG
ncbi:MAG: hypothetical protein AAFY28_01740 [Actinomycetota bacterium]